jgi:hypothetical protein
MVVCLVCSVLDLRAAVTAPFLVIFAYGFFYVSVLSFQAERARRSVPASKRKLAAQAETADTGR